MSDDFFMFTTMILQHLNISSADVNSFVLLPGDPGRVNRIGKQLEGFSILQQNREFRSGNGCFKGIPVTVCSTGIGGPSTAIAVEELIQAGAQTLIRVGTCGGSWCPNIPIGSLCIPSACVRDEGTTREYVPASFPAVADVKVVQALAASTQEQQQRFVVGINRTHDAYYALRPIMTDLPILASDMESSVLFVIASLRGASAGAILAINDDPLSPDDLRDAPRAEKDSAATDAIVENMITAALSAVDRLARKPK